MDGPSPTRFSFVVESDATVPVRKDQFVMVPTSDGTLYARVVDVRKTNRYFGRAESVKEYQQEDELNAIFPVDSWEFMVADAIPLGVLNGKRVERSTFPPSPGVKVSSVDETTLGRFLGFTQSGFALGKVAFHDLPATLDMTKLMQKHLAILAMSGAGKSYTVACLIEELLDKKDGRLGVVVIDTHAEYVSLAERPPKGEDYSDRVVAIDGRDLRIPVPELSAGQIASFVPRMSSAQIRDLNRIIADLRSSMRTTGKPYDLKDIIAMVASDNELHPDVQRALEGWLWELEQTRLFGKTAYPSLESLIEPGRAVIFDISTIMSSRSKQIAVCYLSTKLFNLRRDTLIPPYVEIVEEAHNFIPEGESSDYALARRILETVAREGRKFYASLCLVSQRPKQLSTTALSQCNTHLIMRITNPYDLQHIADTAEGITRETLDSITSLQVGDALFVGSAVNYPVFVRIRQRRSFESKGMKLEDYAREYEAKVQSKMEDVKQFL